MTQRTVYLAGPMDFVGGRTANEWRIRATKQFVAAGWTVLDPTSRPHEGAMTWPEIYRQDLRCVEKADVLLADVRCMHRENTGTASEIFYAHEILRKPVIGWSGKGRKASARLFLSVMISNEFVELDDAVNHVIQWWGAETF